MSLTEHGFERPSYNEILEAQINRAKTLFGETIDTGELTALGKYIRINVADIDNLYVCIPCIWLQPLQDRKHRRICKRCFRHERFVKCRTQNESDGYQQRRLSCNRACHMGEHYVFALLLFAVATTFQEC